MSARSLFFTAVSVEGQNLRGLYRANTTQEALEGLQRLGLKPKRLVPVPPTLIPLAEAFARDGAPPQEVSFLMRQLATMYRAGIPLTKTLDSLMSTDWSPELAMSVRILGRSIHAGATLSDSMRLCPRVFSRACVALVRTGEVSGRLGEALDNCANILEEEAATRQRIGAALSYPAFTFALFSIAVLLMAFLVLPRFAEVLRGFGTQMPLPARLMMHSAEWIFQPWVLVVLMELLLLAVFLGRAWFRTRAGQEFLEGLLERIPPIQRFLSKMWLARLSFTLAALVDAGIPIVEALRCSRSVVGSPALGKALDGTVEHMVNGMDIATAFYAQGFPSTFVQLLKVGEETGQLVALLGFVRKIYEEEVDATVTMFLSLLEPMLLLLMGLCVCAFVLAMMLPMVSIFGAVA